MSIKPLEVADYKRLSEFVRGYADDIDMFDFAEYDHREYVFTGKVIAKERPRTGRGGHTYTPKETREFESKVRKWGKDLGIPKVMYPLKVSLVIIDKTDDPVLLSCGLAGMIFNSQNDVDNCEKAILDGLNKIAYDDDKQIVDVRARRRYGISDGFTLKLQRNGLSKNEYANLLKFL